MSHNLNRVSNVINNQIIFIHKNLLNIHLQNYLQKVGTEGRLKKQALVVLVRRHFL